MPFGKKIYIKIFIFLFREAYTIACLGVTEGDFNSLAYAALESHNYDVALKAFMKTKNLNYVGLIQSIEVW